MTKKKETNVYKMKWKVQNLSSNNTSQIIYTIRSIEQNITGIMISDRMILRHIVKLHNNSLKSKKK